MLTQRAAVQFLLCSATFDTIHIKHESSYITLYLFRNFCVYTSFCVHHMNHPCFNLNKTATLNLNSRFLSTDLACHMCFHTRLLNGNNNNNNVFQESIWAEFPNLVGCFILGNIPFVLILCITFSLHGAESFLRS